MTVVMQQTMPEGTTLEFLDEVTRQMGVETDPPDGLIVHTHFDEGGRIRVIDVWDSTEAFDAFRDGVLMPTMQKVGAERGMDITQAPPPETTMTQVAGLVSGR
jgi:quinol monooxygenase YgiN